MSNIDLKVNRFYKSTWPFCHTIYVVHTPLGFIRLVLHSEPPSIYFLSEEDGKWYYTEEEMVAILEKFHWTPCEAWEIKPPVGFKYEQYDANHQPL